MEIIGKYKEWDIVAQMPEGWRINKTIGTPLFMHIVIDNGKSPLTKECKRALLKVERPQPAQPAETPPTVVEPTPAPILTPEPQPEPEQQAQIDYEFPSQKVNELARKRVQEYLLKDIMFDLMVCELEGWNKLEYIKELKRLINAVAAANSPKSKPQAQLDFFTQNNP
jgi:hypothetical protein